MLFQLLSPQGAGPGGAETSFRCTGGAHLICAQRTSSRLSSLDSWVVSHCQDSLCYGQEASLFSHLLQRWACLSFCLLCPHHFSSQACVVGPGGVGCEMVPSPCQRQWEMLYRAVLRVMVKTVMFLTAFFISRGWVLANTFSPI